MVEVSTKDYRQFGLLLGGFIIGIFGFLIPYFKQNPLPYTPFYIALVLGLMALLYPLSLKPVYRFWMKLGDVLGFINTRIILGFLYYVLIVPIGLIKQLGTDAMQRRFDASANTYRVKSHANSPDRLENPY